MPKASKVVVSLIIPLLAGACQAPMAQTAILSDDYLKKSPTMKDALRGIPYFLPKTVLPVTISGDFVPIATASDKEKQDPKFQDYVVSVSIGQTKQLPDPSARYLLEYLPEAVSSDEFKFTIGANGLLQSVKLTSKDESGEIAKKLAELVKEAAKAVVQFGSGMPLGIKGLTASEVEDNRLRCHELAQKFTITKYLSVSGQLMKGDGASELNSEAQKLLAAMHTSIAKVGAISSRSATFVVDRISETTAENVDAYAVSEGAPESSEKDAGIVFRISDPVTLSFAFNTNGLRVQEANDVRLARANEQLKKAQDEKNTEAARLVEELIEGIQKDAAPPSNETCLIPDVVIDTEPVTVMAQHPLKTFVADTGRGFMVKKRIDMAVTDGVLTGLEVDKPSEVLQAVTLPVEILKTIASIPAELLTLKIKQATDEGGLTKAEAEAIKAQIELIRQKEALKDEKALN